MGVRGLTTFIAKKAEQYLEPYELHDTHVVIDGDNLASQIYNRTKFSAFGGNYDEYFHQICHFFGLLKACNVTPLVLMDGGYEEKKMKTIKARLQTRICAVKHVLPLTNKTIIPLFMREVFVDALKFNNIPVMRCMFEADDEIAILARKLNCPVISYDSDFYIHNVQYIPYVTLTHKIYRKTVIDEKNYEIEIIGNVPSKKKSSKKHQKSAKKVVVGEMNKDTPQEVEEYNYLDCSVYTIENLIGRKSLKKEMLPLFATLLGNDFIERRLLRKFYSHVRVKKGRKQASPQQRRIATIFEWLKNESLKSALHKIVGVMREKERETLLRQINAAMHGYNSEKSEAYQYFGFEDEEIDEGIEDLNSLLIGDEDDNEDEENEDVEQLEEEDGEDEDEGEVEDNDEEENQEDEQDNEEEDQEEDDEYDSIENVLVQERSSFPDWFITRFSKAEFPRCFVDMYKSRRYVNYPQVEDLSLDDSNEIAYPILLRIYAALHSPKPPPTLWYMTRVQRYARFYYKKFENIPPLEEFDPIKNKNMTEFKKIFDEFKNSDEIFNNVKDLPDQIQLYALAIIYWMSKSKLTTSVHLHTIVIAIIVTFIIDRKFDVTHDETKYQKSYSKLLTELKENHKQMVVEDLADLSVSNVIKKITKHEAILSMERLIACFTLKDKFERKHADFNRSQVHAYSELQSVCFFMYSFNALCNYPFANIQMANFFNGFFIYNLHSTLKGRSDVGSFIDTHILKFSPHVQAVHRKLFTWFEKLLPSLKWYDQKRLTKPKVKAAMRAEMNSNRPTVARLKQQLAAKLMENDCDQVQQDESEESSSEFVDMNNKFYQLLKLS